MSGDHDHPHEHEHEHPHEHEHGEHPHTHAHHGHGAGHAHPHVHENTHAHALAAHAPREPLERGCGHGKILFFDCFSGVAGDMTIAGLVDLGVPFSVVETAVTTLPIDNFTIAMKAKTRSGIVAGKLAVTVAGQQPHRTYGAIDDMLAGADLDVDTKTLARAIFLRLGEAEAKAHRMPLRDVHFHEVGAVDAIVDIVGAAAALSYVGAEVVVSPLPMGRGFVRAQHGVLPLPAPATVSCLAGAPTYEVALDAELVTPTGAAIVATAATRFARWPQFAPERVGYGSGTRDLPDRPNMLRVVLGEGTSDAARADDASHVVIEANIDDITGELASHALDAVRAAGALDAWATPITMKKGRPALVLSALATRANADQIAHAMLAETTTIGVRRTPVTRTERPRRIDTVATPYGSIPIKVSGGDFGPELAKPEFDACAAAATAHGVPVRDVIAEALVAWRSRPS